MGKSKNTRGSIIRRAPLSRTVVVSYKDPVTGKRKQIWETTRGETEREARDNANAKLTELLSKLDTGTFVKPSKLTVGEFLEQWLRGYAATNVRARTLQGYRDIVDKYLVPHLGAIRLAQLTPAHLQEYYSKALTAGSRKKAGGLSARTVLHHHRLLSEALTHAVKWGLVGRNVAQAVDPPRPVNKEMDTLDSEGVRKLLEVASRSRYYPLIHLAIFTGMRRSELLALRWKDVDLSMGTLQVVQALHRLRGGQMVFEPPKTKKSRRSIALSPAAVLGLKAHREREEALCGEFGIPFREQRLIFCRLDGSPLFPDVVSEAFMEIAKRAGLRGISLHDLRHTHASLMLRQNIHPKIVQERLGHSTISVTLDLYSHVAPGLQQAAALRFDEGLAQPARIEEPAETAG